MEAKQRNLQPNPVLDAGLTLAETILDMIEVPTADFNMMTQSLGNVQRASLTNLRLTQDTASTIYANGPTLPQDDEEHKPLQPHYGIQEFQLIKLQQSLHQVLNS